MAIPTLYKPQGSIVKVREHHMPLIDSWYEARGRKTPKNSTLSDMGFIVDGRVAGWLYLTNSQICMIEGIISDPNTIPSLRKASLDKLVGFMVDSALALGYTNIFGLSKHPSMDTVAKRYGFKTDTSFKVHFLSDEDQE